MSQPPSQMVAGGGRNSPKKTFFSRFVDELGIHALLSSPRDTKLLCVSRFVRLFAYGATTLILALYLSRLGISEARIGLFMTLTLLGDVVISFLLTLVADALGRRKILLLGSALMAASGIVFAISGNYWILVVASVFGVISPSGNEIGPFRAIEESTLAQLSPPSARSDIFAWLSLLGKAGTAFGTIVCGWLVEALRGQENKSEIAAYRTIFGLYAALGVIKFGLTMMLSDACEPETNKQEYRQVASRDEHEARGDQEAEGLLSDSEGEEEDFNETGTLKKGTSAQSPTTVESKAETKTPLTRKSIWPSISVGSRKTLLRLCLLFAVDSFASGLVPLSWITYFFNKRYGIDSGQLGTMFFATNIIAAISNLVASSLAKRIGLIKTMVFTHLPSAIMLALIPLPNRAHAWLAILFLILRSCLQNMDQAPRQAFLSVVVLPAERTAVMGMVNVIKTLSQSGAPVVTGGLATAGKFWLAFLIAGGMKAGYDLAMLKMFLGYRSQEEEDERQDRQDRPVEMRERPQA